MASNYIGLTDSSLIQLRKYVDHFSTRIKPELFAIFNDWSSTSVRRLAECLMKNDIENFNEFIGSVALCVGIVLFKDYSIGQQKADLLSHTFAVNDENKWETQAKVKSALGRKLYISQKTISYEIHFSDFNHCQNRLGCL